MLSATAQISSAKVLLRQNGRTRSATVSSGRPTYLEHCKPRRGKPGGPAFSSGLMEPAHRQPRPCLEKAKSKERGVYASMCILSLNRRIQKYGGFTTWRRVFGRPQNCRLVRRATPALKIPYIGMISRLCRHRTR